jgi:homoserine O-acetyltransferase
MSIRTLFAALAAALAVTTTAAAAPPPVQEHDFVLHDFRFRSGETLPELRLHYRTLGSPRRDAAGRIVNAVMVLHGTGGSGAQFLRPQFAGVLFAPGGLLDPARYFIILPDDIGHGGSSKPSDGLRARFPHYGYADMVEAEHALAVQGLGVQRLRLLMGTSMGCMHSFMWAERWPDAAAAVMPLACLPVPIAGRNRMWRRMAVDLITSDPAYAGGDYTAEPTAGLRGAAAVLMIAGSTPLPQQLQYPTAQAADAYVDGALEAQVKEMDANDTVYAIRSSDDYDPSRELEKITAPLTWVNSGDDFINPPELGIAQRMAPRIRNGRFVLIPGSAQTHGHGTHTWAALWKDELAKLLARSEGR